MKVRIPLERGATIKIGSTEFKALSGFIELKSRDSEKDDVNENLLASKQEESLIFHLQEDNLNQKIYPPLAALDLPPDAQRRLEDLKQQENFVMSGVRSRFGSGEGNKAKKAKNRGEIEEESYLVFMSRIDVEVRKFELLQIGWEELSKEFSNKNKLPKSEVELYLWIFKEKWDLNYSQCFKKFYGSVTSIERNQRHIQNTILEKLKNNDYTKIEDYCGMGEGWLAESIKILKRYVKKDRFIKKALRNFYFAVAYEARTFASICALQRKGKKRFLLDGNWNEGVYTPRKHKTLC